jgi:small-conductance mechanosensitive channel
VVAAAALMWAAAFARGASTPEGLLDKARHADEEWAALSKIEKDGAAGRDPCAPGTAAAIRSAYSMYRRAMELWGEYYDQIRSTYEARLKITREIAGNADTDLREAQAALKQEMKDLQTLRDSVATARNSRLIEIISIHERSISNLSDALESIRQRKEASEEGTAALSGLLATLAQNQHNLLLQQTQGDTYYRGQLDANKSLARGACPDTYESLYTKP